MMEYSWFKINPFSSSVDEKYDEKKDDDLLMLCRNIPDIMFVIFKTPSAGTTLFLRVPTTHQRMVESIVSFGADLCEKHIILVDSFVRLKLEKSFLYPLVSDKTVTSEIFSVFSDAPYGIFGIKLSHAPSKPIVSKYKSFLQKKARKNDEDKIHVDPYEKMIKQKSECTRFFYSEIFFGVQKLSDTGAFHDIIPHTAQHVEPNRLVQAKITIAKEKDLDAATKILKKTLETKCMGKNMILSDFDILPFVRFPTHPQNIGLDSAAIPTMASDSFDEREFGDLGKSTP